MGPAWRDMAFVMSTSTLAGASLAIIFPLAALVMAEHGWSDALIGANAAIHGLGIFLVAPFMRWLIDGAGAVRCFVGALVVSAAAVLLMPLAVEPWLWFPLRLVIGCCSGLLFVVSEAAVNALAPEARRGTVIGVYATLFSLGYAAGPLVVAVGGHEGWAPFVLAAAILLAGVAPASFARAADGALRGHSQARGSLLGTARRAPLAIATILTFGLTEAAFFGLLPIWGLAAGLDPGRAALLLTVWIAGNILLQVPLGRLADRRGRRRLLLACVVASLTLLCLMNPVAGSGLVWPLLLVMGAAMGGLYTLSLALLGQAFAGPEQPVANTAFIMMFEIGVIGGPALAGLALQIWGAVTLPWASMAPLLLLLAAFAWLGSPAMATPEPVPPMPQRRDRSTSLR